MNSTYKLLILISILANSTANQIRGASFLSDNSEFLDYNNITSDSIVTGKANTQNNTISKIGKPLSILLFGDSMTHNLGLRLAEYAAQNGYELHSITWNSSHVQHWLDSTYLAEAQKQYNPDFYFIMLGANEVQVKDPKSRIPFIRELISRLGGKPFIWIGPAHWCVDFNNYTEMMQEAIPDGHFFRTKGMKLDRMPDGIHVSPAGSRIWMDSIASWLPKSACPIKMEFPDSSIVGNVTLDDFAPPRPSKASAVKDPPGWRKSKKSLKTKRNKFSKRHK